MHVPCDIGLMTVAVCSKNEYLASVIILLASYTLHLQTSRNCYIRATMVALVLFIAWCSIVLCCMGATLHAPLLLICSC